MTDDTQPRRARRGEPITKRIARNGTVSYEFRADVGDVTAASLIRACARYHPLAPTILSSFPSPVRPETGEG